MIEELIGTVNDLIGKIDQEKENKNTQNVFGGIDPYSRSRPRFNKLKPLNLDLDSSGYTTFRPMKDSPPLKSRGKKPQNKYDSNSYKDW